MPESFASPPQAVPYQNLPGFSLGQLLVLMTYLAILLYATFYNSNIFLDQSRTGWIAVSQYPFVYAFAQKNNFIGAFLGFGYEKV
jgi:ferric-chelate reductase